MTLEEIESYREKVLQIMFDVQVTIYNAKIIGNTSTEDEDWVKDHPFFRHYFSQMKFIAVIQLAKLLSQSDNQKLNFQKFLKRLQSEKLPEIKSVSGYEEMEDKTEFYSKHQLMKLEEDIKTAIEKHKSDIKKLTDARDKVFAHSDPNFKDGFLSWPVIESLSELVHFIYNKISGDFTSSEFMFPNKSTWSPEWVIKKAASTRPKRPQK
jgi:hypothetical protein